MSSTTSLTEGIRLAELDPGSVVEVVTGSRCYRLASGADGEVLISGHPDLCPAPIAAQIGSISLDRSTHIPGFVCLGMYMEVCCSNDVVFRTSAVVDIRVL